VGVGGALGAGGQALGNVAAKGATNLLASRQAAADTQALNNSVRDTTLKASQDAGYVVPPTITNPSLTNTALESVSGRAATNQAAMIKNQQVTNTLVKGDLGLAADQPLNQEALQGIRAQAGKVYNQVKQSGTIKADSTYQDQIDSITNASKEVEGAFPGAATPAGDKIDALVNSLQQDSFSAGQAVEYTKRLRNQAAGNFKLAGRSGDPDALALAQAQIKGANALEAQIGRHLEASGNAGLLGQFQAARQKIAQTYTADAALNDSTGNIDARVLAKQLDNDRPLSGGMKTAAQFAQSFRDVAGEPVKGPGVSKLAATVGLTEIGGALMTHHPGLAAAATAAMVAPTLARRALLGGANKYLAAPNYAPGALGTLALKGIQQAPRLAVPVSSQVAPALVQSLQ
ncbi:MAG TPA: hypothetical protein VN541_10675, partial [Tepidisphaeraceae bacterium]|nr:hypothetical protein [Tepidisphaeraceae bacterium]